MSRTYEVVIIGGGPVGVALAVNLGLRGIRCAVVERRECGHIIPRGQNLTQRTLEHFWSWGLAEELRAARAMPKGFPIANITTYKTLISPYWHATAGREVVRRYYFQDNERLPQYATEDVLRKKLATIGNVDNFEGWDAISIAQDGNGVRAVIRRVGGDEEETLEGQYLIGCDGAHSMVREAAGIQRGGSDFDQKMLLAVFKSKDLHDGLKHLPDGSTYRVLDPRDKGYWQFFGRIDVGVGWFFHAPVPGDTKPTAEQTKLLLEKAAGFPLRVDFDYIGLWDLRVAVADRYQNGRILIAGDAAHSHPPYGGYGLNNGLEDIVNLGWKLAARLQGWGSDALIGSYSDERRPIFHETGEDFIASRIREEGEFLDHFSPDKNEAAFAAAWKKLETEGWSRVSVYEPNYEGSPVVWGPTGGRNSAHGEHMLKARAGHHLAPAPLSGGGDVFEKLGAGFALLAFDQPDSVVQGFVDAAKSLGMPLNVVRDSFAGGREAYEARLVLVRPDQYVVWTGDAPPADAKALLSRVVGR